MKKLIILSFLMLSSPFLKAQDVQPNVIGPFEGLNNTDNSMIIPSGQAQDLLNVDVTPGGRSVKKRDGYSLFYNLTNTTSAVHGIYNFYNSAGNDVSLFFNNRRLSVSVSGATPTVLFSTGTKDTTWQCVDSLGFAYCSNSNRDKIIKTDGITQVQISPPAQGKLVAVTPERLVHAGFASFPSRIDFSKANDYTTWQPGGLPTDPVNFTIASPGYQITHITYACGSTMWWKETSFGAIYAGPTLGDWQVRTISPNIGTLHNTSVYNDGILYFQGNDGHIYAYDCATLTKLSRDITGTIAVTQGRSPGTWSQTTQADFQAGSLTSLDATTTAGQLVLTLGTTNLYTSNYGATGTTLRSDTCGSADYQISLGMRSTDTFKLYSITAEATRIGTPGNFTANFRTNSINIPNTILDSVILISTSVSLAGGNVTVVFQNFVSVSSGSTYWINFVPLGTNNSSNYIKWALSSDRAGSGYRCGAGGAWESAGSAPKLKYVGKKYAASGTYLSAVKNAPSLTTWDLFSATTLNNDGTHTFSIRGANTSFTVSSSTPNWVSIANGAIPSTSSYTYFQVRDVIATSTRSTTPILYDFQQSWFEGAATDKTYATYFKNAIWWSVASGTGATTNNRILRFDDLNRIWTIYDIPSNGFLARSQQLYFGSSSQGKIFKYGSGNNDNSAAINAYWKSKDFFGNNPFVDKDLVNLSFTGKSQTNSNVTMTYTLNGNTATSYSVSLYDANSSFIRSNKNIPQGKSGKTFSFKFGNNAADQPFEVFVIQYGTRDLPWKPGN